MRPFDNTTNEGNEKAIRRGRTVPDDAVNLSYVKSPRLSPGQNVVVVDTSRVVDNQTINIDIAGKRKVYYANELGILVNDNGSILMPEEFPIVSDEFSVDEDFSLLPGSEYEDHHVLPFLHTSRHFHLDQKGILYPGEIDTFQSELVKIIDSEGREYVDEEGKPRYRIKIISAFLGEDVTTTSSTWAYRILAFLDTNENENLYLRYSKVELTKEGFLSHRETGYKELLNPQPYFSYNPEESSVVDIVNRNKKQYSSKPIFRRESTLVGHPDGYKVYVPKKAISDPRLYQLFRWRVKCTFIDDIGIDTSESFRKIRCGMIVTNKTKNKEVPGRAPFAFINLQRSDFNVKNINFYNPKQETHTNSEKERASYWFVNIDEDDLSNYDLLIWAPNQGTFNISKYSAKIDYFVKSHGGTFFFDSSNYVDARDTLSGYFSPPVDPITGDPRSGTAAGNPHSGSAIVTSPAIADFAHPLINGAEELSGWDFTEDENNDETKALGYAQLAPLEEVDPVRRSQMLPVRPTGMGNIVSAPLSTVDPIVYRSILAAKQEIDGGYRIVSTIGIAQLCSAIVSADNNVVLNDNLRSTLAKPSGYSRHINGAGVEGGMKMLYNIALLSAKGRLLNSENEDLFSTRWQHETPWQGSWVINALDDEVLDDPDKDLYHFFQEERDIHADEPDNVFVWKRRLSPYTTKQIVDHSLQPLMSDPVFSSRVNNADRVYELEITNPYVLTSSLLQGGDFPSAWTEADSPRFEVPVDFGPHAIKEEKDFQGNKGRKVKFDEELLYSQVEYPPKKYGGQVVVSYARTEEQTERVTGNYTVDLNMRLRKKVNIPPPPPPPAPPPIPNPPPTPNAPTPIPGSVTYDAEVTWWTAWGNNETTHNNRLSVYTGFPNHGDRRPNNISTWNDLNYYNQGASPAYPYWGFAGVLGQYPYPGTSPESTVREHVKFLQDALNRFMRLGYFAGSILTINGIYDQRVANTVKAFQQAFRAQRQDGVVDSETWYIIGSQIVRATHEGTLRTAGSSWELSPYYGWAKQLDRRRLSDGRTDTWVAKRSDSRNGPRRIWEIYMMQFPISFNLKWKTMRVIPFVLGNHRTMRIDFADVRTSPYSMSPWPPAGGDTRTIGPGWSEMVQDSQVVDIILPANTFGDTFLIGISQDRYAGNMGPKGSFFGIRNLSMITEVTQSLHTGTPHWHGTLTHRHGRLFVGHQHAGGTPATTEPGGSPQESLEFGNSKSMFENGTMLLSTGSLKTPSSAVDNPAHDTGGDSGLGITWKYEYETVTVQLNGTISVSAFAPKTRQLQVPSQGQGVTVMSYYFQTIDIDNPAITATIDRKGLARFATQGVDQETEDGTSLGSLIPRGSGTFYSMDQNGQFDPIPEIGLISKDEGVKLFCDDEKKPIGFPSLPVDAGDSEAQYHYSKISLEPSGNHPSVRMCFFDLRAGEFVAASNGKPEMSYIEYIQRGPSNIYVAAVSDFEVIRQEVIPDNGDGILVPFKWAMPVYGVQFVGGSSISLEPMPENLNHTDIWNISVRNGKFSRKVNLRPRSAGPIFGFAPHQGSSVMAYYGIPEIDQFVGYSKTYGKPFVDVVDEQPFILDDDLLQIRQAPIAAVRMPTSYPSMADPVRPLFSVYSRESVGAEWEKVSLHEIRDYNLSTGEIYLQNPIKKEDPSLLKVDYVTTMPHFPLKRFGNRILNFNAHSPEGKDLIGEAIYVYIVPEYLRDQSGVIIPSSINDRTIRVAFTPNIFNPLSNEYNPFAIQLGVVFLSTALDVRDVAMIDTRRRGGGLYDNANLTEINRLFNEATQFWDVSHGAGMSYQKAGFVIIRLPEALKDQLEENEIRTIIERNIASGVDFKIEDLQGQDW